tara:strand:+ start:1299 stop:2108 length:810 start_codon:yes stop_codon:yes gene_type:complete
MKKSYSNKIHDILLENNLSSLKILLEQDEEKPKEDDTSEESGEESKNSETDFDMNDESEGDESGEGESSDDEPSDSDDGPAEPDGVILDDETAKSLTQDIEKFTSHVKNLTRDTLGAVETELSDIFDKAAIGNIGESFYYKDSISRFLNEEKSAEDLQNSMEDFQDTIEKATGVVSDIKKGIVVDIEEYASGAIDTFKSFDNLFEKWKIVKAAAINILATSCGEKAESYIQEFEELFHEMLYKQFGIESDENYLPPKEDKVAAGANKQG